MKRVLIPASSYQNGLDVSRGHLDSGLPLFTFGRGSLQDSRVRLFPIIVGELPQLNFCLICSYYRY